MKRIIGISVIGILYFMTVSFVGAEFISIPASAFNGETSSEDYYNYGEWICKNSTAGVLYAPVDLPDGAVIKNIRVFCKDTSVNDMGVVLYRFNQYSEVNTGIFSISTSGSSSALQILVDSSCDPAPSYRKVYNNVCQYFLAVNFGGTGLYLHGVIIEYQ